MELKYQGRMDKNMLTDCCWMLNDTGLRLNIKEERQKGVPKDWWCRAGRGNAVKTRRVEQAVVSWPLPKNYSSRSHESSLDGAASECSNK
ncbi:hypothetical protein TNCV_2884901 [Trichonephila clavipes]|nr:hypothetical protein TNCV_2884901 [Trichonephila clavipes]